MTLYNIKTEDNQFRITKFDNDLNVDSSYLVSEDACECPAGVRSTCRHRQMLSTFLACDAVDQPMFWDFENHTWYHAPGEEPIYIQPASEDSLEIEDEEVSSDEEIRDAFCRDRQHVPEPDAQTSRALEQSPIALAPNPERMVGIVPGRIRRI
ncbi:MAG: hypothetical protein E6Q97_34820 [Desulfurellales bacterium]|nr:MAG: hypothetical protein E6Q97_34820 [Desulfurellales bacterium]